MTFIVIIFLIPIVGLLIWGIVEPEESIMFGRRWMFDGDVEPSEEALRFHRLSCKLGLIFIGIMLLVNILKR